MKNSCRKKNSLISHCLSIKAFSEKKYIYRFRTKYPSTSIKPGHSALTAFLYTAKRKSHQGKRTGEGDAVGKASETLKVAAFLWLGHCNTQGRTSVREGVAFLRKDLGRKDLLPARSLTVFRLLRCSLNRQTNPRRFALSPGRSPGRAWRARAAPAQQVALSLQM